MFDAQAWIDSHEPPTYVDRAGKKHVGRIWSHLEYLKWLKIFARWKDKTNPPSDEQYAQELRELLASQGFADDVVVEMLALPSVALEEMLKGFFVCQRSGETSAPSPASSTPEPPRPSSSSPTSPSTPPALSPSAS